MRRLTPLVACALITGCAFIDDFGKFEVDPVGADAGDAGRQPDTGPPPPDSGRCGPETCNGEDDDCDGTTDEEPTECSFPNAVVGCVAGACEMTGCVEGFLDCDGEAGCEVDPMTDRQNCGGCGVTCSTGQTCGTSGCQYPSVTAQHILTSPGNAALRRVGLDGTGAIIVTGTTGGSASLDGTAAPSSDDIVARIASSGTVEWIESSPVFIRDIAVIPTGVVYAAGSYTGTLSFGGGSLSSRGGTADAVVLSYEPTGAERSPGAVGSSTGSDALEGIAVREGRWAYVGSADGALPGESHAGRRDAFAGSSLSDLGPFPDQYGGTEDEVLYDVALQADGSYTVIGRYGGTADFGGAENAPDYMEMFSTTSLIVATYDSDGNQTWQLTLPRYYAEGGNRAQVAVDSSGNVYWAAGITGGGSSRPDLGSGPLPGLFIIASYSPDGAFRWAQSTTANVADAGISLSESGTLIVAGDYFGEGDVIPGGDRFPDGGETDCAVLAFDTSTGELLWGTTLTSADSVRCDGVAASGRGAWIGGSFRGTVNFGGRLVTAPSGTSDGFLVFVEPQ